MEEGGDLNQALNWAQTARRSDPESPANADTLGWIQHKLGKRDQLATSSVLPFPKNPIIQFFNITWGSFTRKPSKSRRP